MVWVFPDYMGRTLTITASFNNATRAMTNVVAVRQVGCLYRVLLWGLGADGTPDSSTKKRTVANGTTTVSKSQLASVGLDTIDDILAVQFTVGI